MTRQRRRKKNHFPLFLSLLLLICIGLLLCVLLNVPERLVDSFRKPNPAGSDPGSSVVSETAAALPADEIPQAESKEPAQEADAQIHSLPVYPISPSRVTYQDGFYYEPVSDTKELMERIRPYSFNESVNTKVSYEDLSYLRVRYVNFQDQDCEGELICSNQIAQDLLEIFYILWKDRYQIESIRLIDDFQADDTASMEADNTSAFNYRYSTGSTKYLSNHSYGLSIDINPLYNPYVATDKNGNRTVEPSSAAPYANRSLDFAHKIDKEDLCYQLFTKYGFTWGGDWKSVKDYQHFEKEIK